MSPRAIVLATAVLAACGAAEKPPEPDPAEAIPERCRAVHVDRLADTDWVAVAGKAADPKTRLRVIAPGPDGADYEGQWVGGMFTKLRMKGVKRDKDVQFTEIPSADRAKRVEKGEADLTRLYVEPVLKQCGLKVFAGTVDAKGKEKIPPKGPELVAFPKQEGVEFTYRPPDRPLFLGKAAKDDKVAQAQLAENGGPDPQHELGAVPVGLFSDAAADGADDCTYDMDLYFDDQKVADLAKLPAGDVKDGKRHWFHEWNAPYSGNHSFEMYRYKTCSGGARTLIDVAAIEAVLL